MYISMYYVYMLRSISMYVSMYYVYMLRSISMYVFMYLCMYAHKYMCMYVHMYVYNYVEGESVIQWNIMMFTCFNKKMTSDLEKLS